MINFRREGLRGDHKAGVLEDVRCDVQQDAEFIPKFARLPDEHSDKDFDQEDLEYLVGKLGDPLTVA